MQQTEAYFYLIGDISGLAPQRDDMSEETENSVLEHLCSMRADLPAMRSDQVLTNERLSAIGHHMAGFLSTEASNSSEINAIRARIERIEKRPGLAE